MSSHPHTVPPGWTKGETLRLIGGGPRYALEREFTTLEDVHPDSIGAITFDSIEEVRAFMRWWNDHR